MDSQNNMQNNTESTQSQSLPNHTNTNSTSNHTLLAVLAYIGPLVILSYVLGKDNEFVKYHVKQGLVLFGIEVVLWLFSSFFYPFYLLINLVHLAVLILSVIGVINAVQGEKKELPVVGSLAHSIKI